MKFLDELTGFGSKLSGAVSPYLSLASGIGSLFGNKNIDKQIKAQQEENQKNREYNLMLAQMQNDWSQDQWERENDYNLPINQRKRLEDAGLNPDLMYGNGGIQNIGASSPSMTSGAPSSPTDMSPLGQKKTIGDALRDSLNVELQRAQIDNLKADADRKNLDNDVQRELKDFLGLDFKDVEDVNHYLFSPQAQEYIFKLRGMSKDNYAKDIDIHGKEMDDVIRTLNFDLEKKVSTEEWKAMSEHFNKTVQECKEFIKNASLRLRGYSAEVQSKEADALWNSPDILKQLPSGLPMIVKLLKQVMGN